MPEDDPFAEYTIGMGVKSKEKAPSSAKETPKKEAPTKEPAVSVKEEEDPFAIYTVDEGTKAPQTSPAQQGILENLRPLLQVTLGALKRFTYPLDILSMGAQGAGRGALDEFYEPEEIAEKEKAAQIGQEKIQKYFPTQDLAEKIIEEKTGLPLTPKGRDQELLRLGGSAAAFNPGGIIERGAAALTAPAVSLGAEAAGASPGISDIIGLGASGLLPLIRKGVSSFFPKGKEKALAEGLSGTPPSPPGAPVPQRLRPYDEAARALSTPGEPPPPPPPPPPGYPSASSGSPPGTPRLQAQLPQTIGRGNLARRNVSISNNPEVIPVRPQGQTTELPERVGNIVSPQRFRNSTQGGQAITHEIRAADEQAYRQVNQLYDRSRELNREVQEIHPQLVQRLQNRIAEIDQIADPSGPQRQLRTSMQNQLNRLAQFDEEGNIIGYTPVSNQSLIDQIQASRHAVDYDFGHGKPKNIFRPFIQDLQDAALVAAERNNPEAAEALLEAQGAYRDWVTTFDNDYIRPFRDLSNRDLSKNFKKVLDLDNYSVTREILEATPRGEEFSRGIRREIVEDKLAPFLKQSKKSLDHRELNKTLRELEAVVPEEELSAIRREIIGNRKIRATPQEKPVLKAAQKATNMSIEDIQKEMNSVSGIMRMREKLPSNIYNNLAKDKIELIIRENQISKNFTGKDLDRVLNKRAENDLLSALIGDQAVEDARLVAKQLGDRQMTIDNIKTLGKHVGALNFIKHVIPLIP